MIAINPTAPLTAQLRAANLIQYGPISGVLLYHFLDRDWAPLYIGATCSPPIRWQAHKSTAEWWPLVAWLEVERFAHNWQALEAEREAIRTERPKFNIRSKPRLFQEPPGNGPGMAPESPASESGLARTRAPARRGALETGDRRQDWFVWLLKVPARKTVTREAATGGRAI